MAQQRKEEAQNEEVPAGTKIYLISSFIAILLYMDGHIVEPRFENIPFMIITAVMGFIINIGGVAIYLSGGRKQKVVGVLVNLVSYCAILPFFIFG